MGDHTTIEWVAALAAKRNAIPATWNPIDGCSRASAGCRYCWAAQLVHTRMSKSMPGRYAGLTELDGAGVPRFNGTVRLAEHVLDVPMKARRPRVYFVSDMADLFHPLVSWDWLDRIFARMTATPHHLYLLLTKRPNIMRAYLTDPATPDRIDAVMERDFPAHWCSREIDDFGGWLLHNVLVGCTVEDQPRATIRQREMASIAAAGWPTFVSYEPAIGPVDWAGWEFLSWLFSGGEAGPTPSHPDWHRSARDFCAPRGIPFLFKQWGEWREFDTGSPAVDTVSADDEDSLPHHPADLGAVNPAFVTMDGRTFSRFNDLPEGMPARLVERVGKKRAGRMLDGVIWDQVPEVA